MVQITIECYPSPAQGWTKNMRQLGQVRSGFVESSWLDLRHGLAQPSLTQLPYGWPKNLTQPNLVWLCVVLIPHKQWIPVVPMQDDSSPISDPNCSHTLKNSLISRNQQKFQVHSPPPTTHHHISLSLNVRWFLTNIWSKLLHTLKNFSTD